MLLKVSVGEEPVVELEAADAERILQALTRAGGVAVEGDGEGGDFCLWHERFLFYRRIVREDSGWP